MMINGNLGRTLRLKDKLRVYRNLNKSCFSALACSGEHRGRVVLYMNNCLLKDVVFKVLNGGYQRAIKTNTRNVHSYAIGNLICYDDETINQELTANQEWIEISYNPFFRDHFFIKRSKTPIRQCDMLILNSEGQAYAVNPS